MQWEQWRPYVSVAQRRANALREMNRLRSKGKTIEPVEIEGRTIARSFWGKGWCDHLESFSDYANRLPRGRRYARNGSVCHLQIQPGRIEAIVSGSELYEVSIRIKRLKPTTWSSVKRRCAGRIGSMLELLQGRLSDQVMTVVTDRKDGLFPKPAEIELSCDCPDWATMCKHVAAVLYGVGNRLDHSPELLFLLRHVDADELVSADLTVPGATSTGDTLSDDQLGDIFGIDVDTEIQEPPKQTSAPVKSTPSKPRRSKKARAATSASGGKKSSTATRRTRRTNPSRRATRAAQKQADTTAKVRPTSPTAIAANEDAPRIRPTGKSVARLRRKLGLSVPEFAHALNVSTGSIYRWEATPGRLKLQTRPLAALAKLHRQASAK